MIMAFALTPRDMATSIRGDTITDGPFVDAKEVVAGFYVIEAPDLDAALDDRRAATPRPERRRCRGAAGRTAASSRRGARTAMRDAAAVEAAIADAHRRGWALVLAATVRVARDLDLAEECVQEAYAAALQAWPEDGIPANPARLAHHPAKRRAMDAIRRERVFRSKLPLLVEPERRRRGLRTTESTAPASRRRRRRRTRRAVAADLHCAATRRSPRRPRWRSRCGWCAACATAGHRSGVPGLRVDHGRPAHAGEEEDLRRPDPLPGPRRLPETNDAIAACRQALAGGLGRRAGSQQAARCGHRRSFPSTGPCHSRWSTYRRLASRARSKSWSKTDGCRGTTTCPRSKPTCLADSAAPTKQPPRTGRHSRRPRTKPSAPSSPSRSPATPPCHTEHGAALSSLRPLPVRPRSLSALVDADLRFRRTA